MPNFIKNFLKSAKKTIRHPKRLVSRLAPYAVPALGNYFGGPLLGAIAGAVHGSTTRGHGNKLSGALGGLGKALAYSELASLAADKFGVAPESFLGRMAGAHKGSLLNQTGLMEGARGIGGGSGLFGGYGEPGIISQAMENGLGWKDGMGDIAKSALGVGAKSFLNMATGRMQEHPQEEQEEYDAYPGYNQNGGQYSNNNQNYDADGFGGRFNQENEYATNYARKNGYEIPSEVLRDHNRESNKGKSIHERHKDYIFNKEGRKETKEEFLKKKKKKVKGYAAGGLVRGNNTSGRADDIETIIPDGCYVMNATDVSLLGDGSTSHGAKRLKEFEAPYLRGNNGSKGGKGVRALVSNDEYIISPNTVNSLGKGNNKAGANILDVMRSNLRKHKGVKNILPPASRSIASYMR